MIEPALKFIESAYDDNSIGTFLNHFREKGYCVMPSVFQRESVDAYREQLIETAVKDSSGRYSMPTDSPLCIEPTKAPRLRCMLPGALSHARMFPRPSLFEVSWLISPAESEPRPLFWHKDREHEGMPGNEYHYPRDVHIGMYFEDMTLEHGPTQVISRSHRDQSRSPHSGHEVDSFLCNKQDVVLWDQRLWHRGTTRTIPGLRIYALFGFYSVPTYGDNDIRPMPLAQRRLAEESADPAEKRFYGGPFTQK